MERMVLGALPSSLLFTKKNDGRFPPLAYGFARRHLADPAGKIYYATMEEGIYEVYVKTLAVTGLIQDGKLPKKGFSKETHVGTLASELRRKIKALPCVGTATRIN